MELDAALHRAAAGSYGVVTRSTLFELGMSADQIHRRLRAGVLVRLQPAVYAVSSAPDCFEQRILAACLAAGRGAAASHRSAARLWKLRGAVSDRSEITVPGSRLPLPGGIVVHRSRIFGPVDLRAVGSIPVTRVERTLVDTAAVLPVQVVTGYLEGALVGGLTTLDVLPEPVRRPGQPGVGRLAADPLGTGPVGPSHRERARGPGRRPPPAPGPQAAERTVFVA